LRIYSPPYRIKIIEVGPRDGLQILNKFIPTQMKIDWISSLLQAGCDEIEASSFVASKWVPQLADAGEVCKHFSTGFPERLTYLVPNMKGAERAIEFGAKHLFVTTSASELHSMKNLNQTIKQVLEGAQRIAEYAARNSVHYTASIAASFGYSEDPTGVKQETVEMMVDTFQKAGFAAVTLCDTSGQAAPTQVYELCGRIVEKARIPIGVHLHQNGGIEFANALMALSAGVRIFESAAGGLGGCPYIKNARGNIATEKLVEMLKSCGYELQVDQSAINNCADVGKSFQNQYYMWGDCNNA